MNNSGKIPRKTSNNAINIHKIEYFIFSLNFLIKCKKIKKVKKVKNINAIRIVVDVKFTSSFLISY